MLRQPPPEWVVECVLAVEEERGVRDERYGAPEAIELLAVSLITHVLAVEEDGGEGVSDRLRLSRDGRGNGA